MKKALSTIICIITGFATVVSSPPTEYVDIVVSDKTFHYSWGNGDNLYGYNCNDNSRAFDISYMEGPIKSCAVKENVALVTTSGHHLNPACIYKYTASEFGRWEMETIEVFDQATITRPLCAIQIFQDYTTVDRLIVSSVDWNGNYHTFLSNDFGRTWTVTNLTEPIFAVSFSDSNSDIGYCATLMNGERLHVFGTTNGGVEWVEIISIPYQYTLNQIRNAGHRIHIDTCPVDANKVVVTCHTPFVLNAKTKQLDYIKCEDSSATMTVRKYGFAHNSDRLITFSEEETSLLLVSDDLFETSTEYSYRQWNDSFNTLGYTDGWTRKGKNIYYHKNLGATGIIPLDEMFASVESAENDNVQISATDGIMSVSTPTATDISLTTVDGKCIYSSHTAETSVKVNPGIYIITVGKSTFKVTSE